jgi:hypothetical protein
MKKYSDLATAILFCGFLCLMLVLFLVMPKETMSQKENRVLAEAPKPETAEVLSGGYGEQLEGYIADHLPGRDFLVGLANYYDLLSGRQVTKDILVAKGDRLVEKPNVPSETTAGKMAILNRFAASLGRDLDLMIVPSAGFVLEDTIQGLHGDYTDDAIIADIYALAGEGMNTVDLIPTFQKADDPGALYYRTDHHWTSLGAYEAYSYYLGLKGRTVPGKSEYTVETVEGFQGTTYSRSGLWLTPAEPVELWHLPGVTPTVTVYQNAADTEGTAHEGLFFRDQLTQDNKYTVYLGGNQGMVRIHNPEGEGKILVIRDSYSNCLGAFLAGSYEEVILVDLRYWRTPVSQLVESENIDDVLVCYSLYNFLTDSNIPWLK